MIPLILHQAALDCLDAIIFLSLKPRNLPDMVRFNLGTEQGLNTWIQFFRRRVNSERHSGSWLLEFGLQISRFFAEHCDRPKAEGVALLCGLCTTSTITSASPLFIPLPILLRTQAHQWPRQKEADPGRILLQCPPWLSISFVEYWKIRGPLLNSQDGQVQFFAPR